MTWHHIGPGHGVLELDFPIAGPPRFPRRNEPVLAKTLRSPDRGVLAASPPPIELELQIYWGGGARTRAVWVWSQTGAVAGWAAVGEA